MNGLVSVWVWLQNRLACARRSEDGWGAVEWMVIMVFVVALAYTANQAAGGFLQEKIGELGTN
ncbi:MAG TPA: hypothetical protein VEX15_10195 [Nocardioidaceae bacterium]|nr:hypothetical protein [Nocardioidaceae bacterium]